MLVCLYRGSALCIYVNCKIAIVDAVAEARDKKARFRLQIDNRERQNIILAKGPELQLSWLFP